MRIQSRGSGSGTIYEILDESTILYQNSSATQAVQWAIDHHLSQTGGTIEVACSIPLISDNVFTTRTRWLKNVSATFIEKKKKKTKRKGKLIGGEEIVQG